MAKDQLSAEEMEAIIFETKDGYIPGQPYQFILTQGWVVVGFFTHMLNPITLQLAHCSYYRSAGNQTHARLATHGANDNTAWEYTGSSKINSLQIIFANPYNGKVYRGK